MTGSTECPGITLYRGRAFTCQLNGSKSKIEVLRVVRNLKFGNMTSSGENDLNIRTHASFKWDRTRCPEENVLWKRRFGK